MKRVIGVTCLLVLFCVVAGRGPSVIALAQSTSGSPHAYFNALTARADHWKSYSLRDPRQLDPPKNGGYAECNSCPLYVTYDPANDYDPRRQDAAKILIPDFIPSASLAQPMTATDMAVVLSFSPPWTHGRAIKIDGEIMTVVRQPGVPINNTVSVDRAQHGTVAAPHQPGANILASTNSLMNQVRVPMATSAGHTYLVTWDAWWGAEFAFGQSGIPTHKTFQFASRGIWWEMQTLYAKAFGSGVGQVTTRTYSYTRGPEVTSVDPMPSVGAFTIQPERWTRYWALIDQTQSDYDRVSLWVADEQIDPVLVINRMPLKTVNGTIEEFYLEYNTSTPTLRPGRGPLVAYARNIVMLRDVVDPASIMIRPNAGVPLPSLTPRPSAPKNLRIIVQ